MIGIRILRLWVLIGLPGVITHSFHSCLISFQNSFAYIIFQFVKFLWAQGRMKGIRPKQAKQKMVVKCKTIATVCTVLGQSRHALHGGVRTFKLLACIKLTPRSYCPRCQEVWCLKDTATSFTFAVFISARGATSTDRKERQVTFWTVGTDSTEWPNINVNEHFTKRLHKKFIRRLPFDL